MENTNQPNPPQKPNEPIPAVEARLSALEQRMTEQSAAFETITAGDPRVGKAELSAELDHHRDQLRDYEKALVERIADVDDDRRATASRLQRAWQTQREEIDERLRRHMGLLGGLLMLFAILFAVALFLVYRQAATGQPQLAEEVATVRQELVQSTGDSEVDEQIRDKLGRLAAEVGEIATALERVDQGGEQGGQAPVVAALAADIGRLDAEQGRLAEAVGALRSALDALEADRAAEPAGVNEAGTAMPAAAPTTAASSPVADAVATAAAAGPEPDVAEEGLSAAEAEGGGGRSTDEGTDAVASGSQETVVAGGDIYALQLIGFFDRDALDEFVARDGLPARVYSIRQTYRGRPWYAVVHSLHDDYAAAEDELSRLPADLVALKPWIRPISEVIELEIVKTGQEPE